MSKLMNQQEELNKVKNAVKSAYEAIEDKKGENIKIIDISQVSAIADYFMIAHGTNTNHVQALADHVEKTLSTSGMVLKQIEGYNTAGWILLDYGNIIIHIFSQEERKFYDLDKIWKDGKMVEIGEL